MRAKEKIQQILTQAFNVQELTIIDESALHAGHAGVQAHGGGHFRITLVSSDFENLPLLNRHRVVKDALKSEFKSLIHALSIKAITPTERANQP